MPGSALRRQGSLRQTSNEASISTGYPGVPRLLQYVDGCHQIRILLKTSGLAPGGLTFGEVDHTIAAVLGFLSHAADQGQVNKTRTISS